jgi:hypothetical protein
VVKDSIVHLYNDLRKTEEEFNDYKKAQDDKSLSLKKEIEELRFQMKECKARMEDLEVLTAHLKAPKEIKLKFPQEVKDSVRGKFSLLTLLLIFFSAAYKTVSEAEGTFHFPNDPEQPAALTDPENALVAEAIFINLCIPETADEMKFKEASRGYLEEFFQNKRKVFNVGHS